MDSRCSICKLIEEALISGASKDKACEILGYDIRTIQRWDKKLDGDGRKNRTAIPKNSLSAKEREEIISCCCEDRFIDMTPNEIVPLLAEEGVYKGSESTFYRVWKIRTKHAGVPGETCHPIRVKHAG